MKKLALRRTLAKNTYLAENSAICEALRSPSKRSGDPGVVFSVSENVAGASPKKTASLCVNQRPKN
jgi:hypothetical protein